MVLKAQICMSLLALKWLKGLSRKMARPVYTVNTTDEFFHSSTKKNAALTSFMLTRSIMQNWAESG